MRLIRVPKQGFIGLVDRPRHRVRGPPAREAPPILSLSQEVKCTTRR
jgi:hypothetical protein